MPHKNNIHSADYDFAKLKKVLPELSDLVRESKSGKLSIDFSDPNAVYLLNKAILMRHYKIKSWHLPKEYLCPAIPGRAEYLHQIFDLPIDEKTKHLLDIGTGASCIYPILAVRLFRYKVVASESDALAMENALKIVWDNELEKDIDLQLQKKRDRIFKGIIKSRDRFDFSVCNPPFYENAELAEKVQARKRKNLAYKSQQSNFQGKDDEMIYPGGEKAFVLKMIQESFVFKNQVTWFTTLISNHDHLKPLVRKLKNYQNIRIEVKEMSLGNKKSRILCWGWDD